MPAVPKSVRPAAWAACSLAVAAAASLWSASAALASTTISGNWAGYSAHGTNVHFRTVSGRWRVSEGTCTAGRPSYSSVWIGLGGYSGTSKALEQTGTELDCASGGQTVYSAWYELVPAAAHQVSLGVRAGDLMQSAVTANGHRITILLQDLTDHRSFRHTFYAAQVDTSSADWIVEAPSACETSGNCFTLPLADFGSVAFSSSSAVTQNGHRGGVTSRWWATATIVLRPHASRFFAGTADPSGAEATPSALSAGGSAFSVAYKAGTASSNPTGPAGPFFQGRIASGRLVHPRR